MTDDVMAQHLATVRERNQGLTAIELKLAAQDAMSRAEDPELSTLAREAALAERLLFDSMASELSPGPTAAEQIQALRDAGDVLSADAMQFTLDRQAAREGIEDLRRRREEASHLPEGQIREAKLGRLDAQIEQAQADYDGMVNPAAIRSQHASARLDASRQAREAGDDALADRYQMEAHRIERGAEVAPDGSE